jgi:hypothetical protein
MKRNRRRKEQRNSAKSILRLPGLEAAKFAPSFAAWATADTSCAKSTGQTVC